MRVTRFGADWLVPGEGPPIAAGRVAVRGDRIVWVGRSGDPGEPEGRLVDLGRGVLLPGPVNAHTHLELSGLEEVDATGGFTAWVSGLLEARPRRSADETRAAMAAAAETLVAAGTAAVGDVSNTLSNLDLLGAAPIEAVVFHEMIGWDPASARSLLEAGEARRKALDAGLDVRPAAHTAQSVSPELLRLMTREGGVASIHVAESLDEVEYLRTGAGPWGELLERRGLAHVAFDPPGTSPVAYLESLGVLRPGLVAVHCVHVNRRDLDVLARRRVRIVLCPRSNRALGVGVAPVPAMLEGGLEPGLGTDSLASAPSLDVLEEAAELHRSFPGIAAPTLVRMATTWGAQALGIPDLGRLAPDFRAALAFAAFPGEVRDPEGFLVSGEARTMRVPLAR